MVPATKSLFALTAADLMTEALVLVMEEMSLKGAAHRLANASITGAPVVDREGRCVGVLSATDFMHWMDRCGHTNPSACMVSPAFHTSWQNVDPAQLPDETVRDYMTPNPVTVPATATLGELAEHMIDVHIHRVIVVDGNGKPIGIVSSTDILAAVTREHQARMHLTEAFKGRDHQACCS